MKTLSTTTLTTLIALITFTFTCGCADSRQEAEAEPNARVSGHLNNLRQQDSRTESEHEASPSEWADIATANRFDEPMSVTSDGLIQHDPELYSGLIQAFEAMQKDPANKESLRAIIAKSFAIRQRMQATEIAALKKRLDQLEQRLALREATADKIIDNYVEILSKNQNWIADNFNQLDINTESAEERFQRTADLLSGHENFDSVANENPNNTNSSNQNNTENVETPLYRVQSGDQLGIYIPGVLGKAGSDPPTIQATANSNAAIGYPIRVREDGMISLPMLDPIPVKGLSLAELEKLVKDEYVGRKILHEKGTTVMVSMVQDRALRMKRQLESSGRRSK